MAQAVNYGELNSGTIIKATTVDGSTSAISIITGTAEPFTKIFKNGIIVENWDGTEARIETDLVVSGSMIYENIYSYSGGTTTLGTGDFGNSSVLLISVDAAATVTIQLPSSILINNQAKLYIIKKLTSTGTITIDPVGTTEIDGNTSVSATTQYSYIQLIYSGNSTDDYLIIANNGFS